MDVLRFHCIVKYHYFALPIDEILTCVLIMCHVTDREGCLHYRNGEVIGNHVRVTDSLGTNYTDEDLESFLFE